MSRSGASAHDRHSWPVCSYSLGNEPPDDLSATTTPEERLAMMWPLALEAWELTGRPLPQYERRQTPLSLRPSTRAPDARA
jgi:hypothetical protein